MELWLILFIISWVGVFCGYEKIREEGDPFGVKVLVTTIVALILATLIGN